MNSLIFYIYFSFSFIVLDSPGLFGSQLISTEDYHLECFGADLADEGIADPTEEDDSNKKRNENLNNKLVDKEEEEEEEEERKEKEGITKEELTSEVTRIYKIIKVC